VSPSRTVCSAPRLDRPLCLAPELTSPGLAIVRAPSSNSPVQDISSPFMACNDKGSSAASTTLTVAAGDTIEPEWYHSGARGADPIDPSHKGPLTAWIAPYAADGNSIKDAWVQIASEAYYPSSSEWAVSHMIANKGRQTVSCSLLDCLLVPSTTLTCCCAHRSSSPRLSRRASTSSASSSSRSTRPSRPAALSSTRTAPT